MRVLLLHQVHKLVFELINHQNALRSVAELDEGLQHAAAVMFETQLNVLLTDGVDALLDDCMLVSPGHFLFFHEKPVVRNLPKRFRHIKASPILTLSFLIRSEIFCFCRLD